MIYITAIHKYFLSLSWAHHHKYYLNILSIWYQSVLYVRLEHATRNLNYTILILSAISNIMTQSRDRFTHRLLYLEV